MANQDQSEEIEIFCEEVQRLIEPAADEYIPATERKLYYRPWSMPFIAACCFINDKFESASGPYEYILIENGEPLDSRFTKTCWSIAQLFEIQKEERVKAVNWNFDRHADLEYWPAPLEQPSMEDVRRILANRKATQKIAEFSSPSWLLDKISADWTELIKDHLKENEDLEHPDMLILDYGNMFAASERTVGLTELITDTAGALRNLALTLPRGKAHMSR